MPETLGITHWLNAIFGTTVTSVAGMLGIHPDRPAAPISDAFALELLIALGMIAFFLIVRVSLSVEKPALPQQFAEMIHEFTGGQLREIIGHNTDRFQAFVTCIFVFVLLNNLVGLFPGLESPTKFPVVPLGLAVLTFLYYNFYGFKEQGVVGYVKHFGGPVWWISWLLFPIEIISHCARVMSLTIRLYANMLAGDLVTMVFFSLMPFAIPCIFLGLHVAVSVIQAFIFMLLTIIYLSQAVAHEH